MNASCHTYECVMSHIWMSHVTQSKWANTICMWTHHIAFTNEFHYTCIWFLSHIYKGVMSHVSTSHVTHINESCHTYQRVMSHCITHAYDFYPTYTKASCHTYQRVMSHIWMSHVTHINESCHTYEWVMSHISTSHVTHINVPIPFVINKLYVNASYRKYE